MELIVFILVSFCFTSSGSRVEGRCCKRDQLKRLPDPCSGVAATQPLTLETANAGISQRHRQSSCVSHASTLPSPISSQAGSGVPDELDKTDSLPKGQGQADVRSASFPPTASGTPHASSDKGQAAADKEPKADDTGIREARSVHGRETSSTARALQGGLSKTSPLRALQRELASGQALGEGKKEASTLQQNLSRASVSTDEDSEAESSTLQRKLFRVSDVTGEGIGAASHSLRRSLLGALYSTGNGHEFASHTWRRSTLAAGVRRKSQVHVQQLPGTGPVPSHVGVVVPLKFHSCRHLSTKEQDIPRRLEEVSPSTGLYGNLLTLGYYYVEVWVGDPRQRFSLLVDTGSSLTLVPDQTCGSRCGKHMNPRYEANTSATHRDVHCSSPECASDWCDARKRCLFTRRYAEDSGASGILASDVLAFSPPAPALLSASAASRAPPQDASGQARVVFGRVKWETGQLFGQKADGVLGLGRSARSFVNQLANEHKGLRRQFTICYSGVQETRDNASDEGEGTEEGGGGVLAFGEGLLEAESVSQMTFTPFDGKRKRSGFFQVSVEGIRVAGETVPVEASVLDRGYGALVDSGTTFTFLPEQAFAAFQRAVLAGIQGVERVVTENPHFHELCFQEQQPSNWSDLGRNFPLVELILAGHAVYSLAVENYVFKHYAKASVRCIGIHPNPDPEAGILLGALLWQNTLLTFDLEGERLGFVKSSCAAVGQSSGAPGGAELAHGEQEQQQLGQGHSSTAQLPEEQDLDDAQRAGAGSHGEEEHQAADSHDAGPKQKVEPGEQAAAEGHEHAGPGEVQGSDVMATALALAGAELSGAIPGDGGHGGDGDEAYDESSLVKSFKTVDPQGCEGCAAFIDFTLSFHVPSAPTQASEAAPPLGPLRPDINSWAFLIPLLQANLSLFLHQVLLVSVAQNTASAWGSGGATDVKIRIVPFGFNRFIPAITSKRVRSAVYYFSLPPPVLARTGPFNVTYLWLQPATFDQPVSPPAPPSYGGWRPYVFATLGVLALALVVLWLCKVLSNRKPHAKSRSSYLSMASQSPAQAQAQQGLKHEPAGSAPGAPDRSSDEGPMVTTYSSGEEKHNDQGMTVSQLGHT